MTYVEGVAEANDTVVQTAQKRMLNSKNNWMWHILKYDKFKNSLPF